MEALVSQIKVIAIDETRHWSKDIQDACGKIEAVYMYDAAVKTFCCEITPSYELTPLYYVTEKEVSDELHSRMMKEEMNPIYMHCRVVDELESISTENGFDFSSSEDEDYKEGFEEAREYLSCNHLI